MRVLAVVGQHHMAPVRLRCQAASRIDRIHYRQRNVGDGLLARLSHFARHVGFLRAECRDADIHLRALNHRIQPGGDLIAHLGQRFADDADFADIGVEDRAIGIHPVARIAGAAVLTCGGGQLRVVPDGNHQHVADADAILVVLKLAIQFRIRAGVDFARQQLLHQPRCEGIDVDHIIQIVIAVRQIDHIFALGAKSLARYDSTTA
ncbi:Uncharacterised protein [Klebsiella pneumoniae]|nr:Uncharacterised protein [Klebsiella pneumoniae]